MKRLVHSSIILVFTLFFVGCIGLKKENLTRVDIQKVNSEGIAQESDVITDKNSLESFKSIISKINWENIQPKIARYEDLTATLFFQDNKNMPERLYVYRVWLNTHTETATIISDNEEEGYGEIDKEQTSILLNMLTNWEPRNEYKENDKVLFRMNPDPELTVGSQYGYIFSFTELFETFKGKKISIYAYSKETGERLTALPAMEIHEPSQGYDRLTRFTTNFELPSVGLWRIEVVLDDQIYGDVVISVKE